MNTIKKTFILGVISLSLLNNGWASAQTIDLSVLSELSNVEKIKPAQKDQKALVYFWASWCGDCRSKLKGDLKKLHESGVQIFTINKDSSQKKASRFISKHKIELPVYLDKEKVISKALKAFSVPHWAVVKHKEDKSGKKIWTVLKYGSGSIESAAKKTLLAKSE